MAHFRNPFLIPLALAAVLAFLPGCSGGGGTARTQVAVLLTDAPAPALSRALVTITSIELLADQGKTTVFSGEKTVDLLDLPGEACLFAVSDQIPAGSYHKIRLQVSALELFDAAGEPVGPVKLPSGKIDLNPRGSFRVQPGIPLLIRLDLDAEKSIHLVAKEGGDEYNFRPVVFVDIASAPDMPTLTRVEGTVTSAADDGTLVLETGEGSAVTVLTGAGTGFFGPEGLPAAHADLAPGDLVRAAGFPALDPDGFLALDARVVEEGAGWKTVAGTVVSAPAASLFTFAPHAAEGLTSVSLPALLQPGTALLGPWGAQLGPEELTPGLAVRVDAVERGEGGSPLLRTALVAAKSPASCARGTITALDLPALAFSLKPAETPTVAVEAGGDTVVLVTEEAGGDLLLREAAFEELALGMEVAVSGDYDGEGVLQAAAIAAWAP